MTAMTLQSEWLICLKRENIKLDIKSTQNVRQTKANITFVYELACLRAFVCVSIFVLFVEVFFF